MSTQFLEDNLKVIKAWERIRNEDTLELINGRINNFVNGVEYEVAPAPDVSDGENGCHSCYFYTHRICCSEANCLGATRVGGSDVIFLRPKPLIKGT